MGTWRPSRSSLWAAGRVESWVQAAGRQATHGVSSLPIDNGEEGRREPEPRSYLVHARGPVGDRLGAFQGHPWTYPPDFRPAQGPMFRLHPRPHCPVQDAWMDTLPKSLPEDAAQEYCPDGRALNPHFSAILAPSPTLLGLLLYQGQRPLCHPTSGWMSGAGWS